MKSDKTDIFFYFIFTFPLSETEIKKNRLVVYVYELGRKTLGWSLGQIVVADVFQFFFRIEGLQLLQGERDFDCCDVLQEVFQSILQKIFLPLFSCLPASCGPRPSNAGGDDMWVGVWCYCLRVFTVTGFILAFSIRLIRESTKCSAQKG